MSLTRFLTEVRLTVCCILAALLLTAGSCHRNDASPLVAKVYNHELHRSDLVGLVGEGVSAEDSMAIVSAYIDQWVRQMVVLSKAEKNVTEDFSRQLGDYRNSLVLYAYERQIIDKLLDTVFTDEEVAEYYNTHLTDFRLKNSIVKTAYVIAPRRSSADQPLRRIVGKASFGDAEVVEMEHIASRHGLNGYYDADTWIPFYNLQSAVPITTYNENLYLKQNRSIVISDDSLTYYVRIIDYKVSDDVSPLETQQQAIRSILLNRRKVELLARMQEDLMAEAEKGGHIERLLN